MSFRTPARAALKQASKAASASSEAAVARRSFSLLAREAAAKRTAPVVARLGVSLGGCWLEEGERRLMLGK